MYIIYAIYVNIKYDIDITYALLYKYYIMSEPKSERIITPMPQSLINSIDNYRFEKHIASRAEAIRRLLMFALQNIKNEQTDNT